MGVVLAGHSNGKAVEHAMHVTALVQSLTRLGKGSHSISMQVEQFSPQRSFCYRDCLCFEQLHISSGHAASRQLKAGYSAADLAPLRATLWRLWTSFTAVLVH